MINTYEEVKALFDKALEDDSVEEIYEEEDNHLGYFVEDFDAYERFFYFNETPETIENRILMDEEVEAFLDKKALSNFLYNYMDKNTLMAMNKMVFVFDSEENTSKARKKLYDETWDEYAMYICEEGTLGITWVEKQMIIVNVSEILKSATQIANEPEEWHTREYIFAEGLLQTIFHEGRHLFYECNEIVPIGEGTNYPEDGGKEYRVEYYGNDMAEMHISEFNTNCIHPKLCEVLDTLSNKLGIEYNPTEDRDLE